MTIVEIDLTGEQTLSDRRGRLRIEVYDNHAEVAFRPDGQDQWYGLQDIVWSDLV